MTRVHGEGDVSDRLGAGHIYERKPATSLYFKKKKFHFLVTFLSILSTLSLCLVIPEFITVRLTMRLKVILVEIIFVFVFGHTAHCLLFAFSTFHRRAGCSERKHAYKPSGYDGCSGMSCFSHSRVIIGSRVVPHHNFLHNFRPHLPSSTSKPSIRFTAWSISLFRMLSKFQWVDHIKLEDINRGRFGSSA